jgi:hypothetical protein
MFHTANVSEKAKLFQTTTKKVKEKFWRKNMKVRLHIIIWILLGTGYYNLESAL